MSKGQRRWIKVQRQEMGQREWAGSCLYNMKLNTVNVDTKAKVLTKFGSLETVCVDMRPKKQAKLPHYRYM